MKADEPLRMILSLMPPRLRAPLERAAASYAARVQEITLRAGRPLCIYCTGGMYCLDTDGLLGDRVPGDPLCVTGEELQSILMKLCDYSVYSHQDELNRGYITATGGLRVGVCGSAVMKDGRVANMNHITTLSFRVPREVIDCSKTLLSLIRPLRGALICGPPCSGKTTLVRDAARALSYTYRVSVADERGELAGNISRQFSYDMGLCDVYAGMPKGEAVLCAVRSMAPDIIVCDEMGDSGDVASVRYALRCGAACIATVHAASMEDLRSRPVMRELLSAGAFRYLVFLDDRRAGGRISRIYEWCADDA